MLRRRININIQGAARRFFVVISVTILLSVCSAVSVYAQSKALIKNVDFELVNNKVIITYDIVKHRSEEMYKIWIKVYTAQENELKSAAVTGAVGENVAGGNHKKIVWDPKEDGVYLYNDIYIQVFASSMSSDQEVSETSMNKWLMLSALYPGVGNAKMRSNKLWLGAGALGYGCMIGSALLNSKASASYNNYLVSQDITERNNLYNDADSQKQLSTILFVSGAVIWAADLIVFYLSARKSGSSSGAINNKPVYLGYSNEAIDGHITQRLTLKMTF